MTYLDKGMPIMHFQPDPKSPFFDMRLLMFVKNPMGNLVFFMASNMASVCCYFNNQGMELILI